MHPAIMKIFCIVTCMYHIENEDLHRMQVQINEEYARLTA